MTKFINIAISRGIEFTDRDLHIFLICCKRPTSYAMKVKNIE